MPKREKTVYTFRTTLGSCAFTVDPDNADPATAETFIPWCDTATGHTLHHENTHAWCNNNGWRVYAPLDAVIRYMVNK